MTEILYPKQVILEVTNHCNLRCKGCALHGPQAFTKRPKGFMPEEIWRKAIAEMGTWPQEVNLTTHGGGEPLLHPHLKEILEFAGRFPNLKRGFLSNATLLTEDWADFLLSTGIDWIAFSIDGTVPETHAIVRRGSDLKKIEQNLLNFIQKGKKAHKRPQIMLNMVLYEEVKAQAQEFVKKWLPFVNVVMLSHYRNPPCSKRWPGEHGPRRPCDLLWSQMVVAWDGSMGLCCEDFDIEVCLGDVRNEPLLAIWNNKAITKFRELHRQGRQQELALCHACDTWADMHAVTEEDRENGYLIVRKASSVEYRTLTP